MSVVRRETLKYIYTHGPIIVDDGQHARQAAIPKILEVLNESFAVGTKGSVAYALLELVQARALEEGGSGAGKHYSRRRFLGITDVGKRELALRLRQAGMELDDELKAFIAVKQPEPNGDDPIERLQERQREIDSSTVPETEGSIHGDGDDAPFLDGHVNASPEEIEAFRTRPEPQIDVDALAQTLLAKVIEATRDGDQWAEEIERLEREQREANERHQAEVEDLNRRLDDLNITLAEAQHQVAQMTTERDEAKRLHAKANEKVREMVAEQELLRTPQGNALREEDRKKLRDMAMAAGLMTRRPAPGPVNARDDD